MSEERRVHRKKLLIRYLALAACILVIAAVTVTAIAAANNWFRPTVDMGADNAGDSGNGSGDNQGDNGGNGEGNGGSHGDGEDEGNNGDENEDKPTATSTTFALPVSVVDVTFEYDFLPNPSLCNQWSFHSGVDMAAEVGTQVFCCLDGKVESVTTGDYLDGTTVTVTHADGLKTVYSFIDAKSGLKAGDSVKRGDVLGTVAEANGSEYLQGAHLHFEVHKNGVAADPADYLELSSK